MLCPRRQLRVEGEIAVALDGFGAFSLEEAALEEESLLVDFQQEHRARGGAGCAEKLDLHAVRMAVEVQSSRRKVKCRLSSGVRLLDCPGL